MTTGCTDRDAERDADPDIVENGDAQHRAETDAQCDSDSHATA